MHHRVLASDYDETLARHGRLEPSTLAALERLKASGRLPVLVTGRELEDLLRVCPDAGVFARIVAENGAVLYDPTTKQARTLAEPPPPLLAERLRARGVPVSVGHVIVATVTPHEGAVLDTIRELGLEQHVIFNKGAVMILPSGVNKETGLRAALAELGASIHETVGVGDGENDHAFIGVCECGVSVANGVPMLRARADLVTRGEAHLGVEELIARILADDLADVAVPRHDLVLGLAGDAEVRLPPRAGEWMVVGPAGDARAALVGRIVEGLIGGGYQCCWIDPGDRHAPLKGCVELGNAQHAPGVDELFGVLADPSAQVVVRLVALPRAERLRYCAELIVRLQEMRARTGRPHRIVVDEAAHALPVDGEGLAAALSQPTGGMLYLTAHPDRIAPAALASIDTVLSVDVDALRAVAAILGDELPPPSARGGAGQATLWRRRPRAAPQRFDVSGPRAGASKT